MLAEANIVHSWHKSAHLLHLPGSKDKSHAPVVSQQVTVNPGSLFFSISKPGSPAVDTDAAGAGLGGVSGTRSYWFPLSNYPSPGVQLPAHRSLCTKGM